MTRFARTLPAVVTPPPFVLAGCLALLAGCAKREAPETRDAQPQVAPEGVLVNEVNGACSALPCPTDTCAVACPPRSQMFTVDIQEPLRGRISVVVEGQMVLRENVPVVPTTGLTARVRVRPRGWPADVEVRVDDLTGRTRAEQKAPFVGVRPGDAGQLAFRAAAEAPMYE